MAENRVGFDELLDSDDRIPKMMIERMTELLKAFEKLQDLTKKKIDLNQSGLKDFVTTASQLLKVVKDLNPTLEKDQQIMMAVNKQSEMLSTGYSNMTTRVKDLEGALKKTNATKDQIEKTTIKLTKAERAYLAALEAKKTVIGDVARKTAELNAETNRRKKALRDAAKEADITLSLYDKEVIRLNKLQKEFKDTAYAKGIDHRETRKLKKELDLLYGSIMKVEKAAGQSQRNVGNYSSALNGLAGSARNFLAAFGVVGGVTMLAYLIRDTFELIKQSETLDRALKNVTETTSVYNQQIDFLRRLSNDYGIQLNTLTESYTKFFVATKGTRLEGKQTQEIFESVTKSLATMGASTENTDRALRALYQMISKGKIQAEELRGQLGDALPGAFSVMAKSLNVTTGELDKMLKDGKLLADEVLPGFAKELEKAFGVENLGRVETLRAEQTRLTNSWIEFVKSVENGEGIIAKALMSVMSGMSKVITVFANNQTEVEKRIAGVGSESQESVKNFIKVLDEIPFEKLSKYADDYRKDVVKLFKDEKESIHDAGLLWNAYYKDREKTQDVLTQSQSLFNIAQTAGIESFSDFQKSFGKSVSAMKNGAQITGMIAEKYDELEKAKLAALKGDEEHIPLLKLMNDELEDLVKLQSELYTKSELDANQKKIDLLESEIKKVMALEFEYKSLKQTTGAGTDGGGVTLPDLPAQLDKQADAIPPKISKIKKIMSDLGLAITDIIDTAFSAASTVVNQFFTNYQIRQENAFAQFESKQDAEIAKLEERRERELENERLTTEQKRQINERYANQIESIEDKLEKKRLDSQRKQARVQKAQSAFNVALSTAEAIIKFLALGNPGLSLAAGIVGGIQLAAVLSEPLPAFFKGTDNAPAGPKIVSEKGPELVQTPGGRSFVTGNKGPEVRTDIPAGSKIIPADLTKKLLEGYQVAETPAIYGRAADNMQKVARQEKLNNESFQKSLNLIIGKQNDNLAQKLDQSLKSLPLNVWGLTDKGQITRGVRKNGSIWRNIDLERKY